MLDGSELEWKGARNLELPKVAGRAAILGLHFFIETTLQLWGKAEGSGGGQGAYLSARVRFKGQGSGLIYIYISRRTPVS